MVVFIKGMECYKVDYNDNLERINARSSRSDREKMVYRQMTAADAPVPPPAACCCRSCPAAGGWLCHACLMPAAAYGCLCCHVRSGQAAPIG
jgi:hypothetical protein